MLKKFIINVVILIAPFVLLGSFFLSYLTKTGELYYSYNDLLYCQQLNEPCLIGLAHTNPASKIKVLSLTSKKYDVIVLGTSRVMSFRSSFFKAGSFYNAGGCIYRIKNMRNFFAKIPRSNYPKVLILGLDQNFFNAQWDNNYSSDSAYVTELNKAYSFSATAQEAFLGLLGDIKNRKISIKDIRQGFKKPSYRKRGLTAFYKENGFINDGSYYYGDVVTDPNSENLADYKFKDTLDRIAKGNRLFEHGKEINPAAIEELRLFLDECRQNNIHVVGFIPPYAQEIYDKLIKMEDNYSYIKKVYPAIREVFAKYNYPVMDFTDMKSFGAPREEIVDGIHASEKAYLRIFLELIDKDPMLKSFSADEKYLKMRLANASSPVVVFSMDESVAAGK